MVISAVAICCALRPLCFALRLLVRCLLLFSRKSSHLYKALSISRLLGESLDVVFIENEQLLQLAL
jgi:hypothetical protein